MSFTFGKIWSQNKKNPVKRRRKSNFMNNKLVLSNKVVRKQSPEKSKIKIYTKKNLPWAYATWHLFHIIPARISDNNFRLHKELILKFISHCCNKLPCPYCKKHAQNYIRRYTLARINTKQQLEEYLFNFHNNAHRVPRHVKRDAVLPQYKTMNIQMVFKKFEQTFFQSFIGGRYFSDWIRNDFKSEYYTFKNTIINKLN